MLDVKRVRVTMDYPNTTSGGYSNTSAHAYQMGVDQNMTSDHNSVHYNNTDVPQAFQNVTTDDEIFTSEYPVLLLILGIFKCILPPFIWTGNCLTILVVMKYINKVTPTHVTITFLASAGFFVGIVPVLSLTFYLVGDSAHSKYIYGLNSWVTAAARTLSVSAILLIAVERCFLVTYLKLYQKNLTIRRQVGLCIAFCVLSLFLATMYALQTDYKLRYGALKPQSEHKSIINILLIPSYALFTCILVCCYLKILLFLWKTRKTLASSQTSSNQQSFQKEKKTTSLIVIILTVYLIGTLPTVVYTVMIRRYPKIWNFELWEFLRVVWCVTALVDTYIYAWKVPEIRNGYCKLLCCLRGAASIRLPLRPMYSIVPLEPRREFDRI